MRIHISMPGTPTPNMGNGFCAFLGNARGLTGSNAHIEPIRALSLWITVKRE